MGFYCAKKNPMLKKEKVKDFWEENSAVDSILCLLDFYSHYHSCNRLTWGSFQLVKWSLCESVAGLS